MGRQTLLQAQDKTTKKVGQKRQVTISIELVWMIKPNNRLAALDLGLIFRRDDGIQGEEGKQHEAGPNNSKRANPPDDD